MESKLITTHFVQITLSEQEARDFIKEHDNWSGTHLVGTEIRRQCVLSLDKPLEAAS